MKSISLKLLTFAFFSSLCATIYAADPSGSWQGAIETPNGSIAISITLDNKDGENSGSIDIPAQGLRGFKLSNVEIKEKQINFEMQGVPGDPRFEGNLEDSGNTITGSLKQAGQTFAFSLELIQGEKKEKGPYTIPGEGMAGEWIGSLDLGVMKPRFALHVAELDDGAFKASFDSIDSIDENIMGLQIDEMDFKEGVLNFRIEKIGLSYHGKMNFDGSIIDGTWSRKDGDRSLILNRIEKAFSLNRPQVPKAPFPYRNEEVTFRNESADISLAGTYVIPEGEGPFPTALFITGSGPQDRDESVMGHKPFLIIADYLARRGIASLRYDDRGAGKSGGKHMSSTVTDFAKDAEAGIAFLLAQPAVNSKAIGIIGHSEGGLSGPIVASTNSEVDFLILLAPPGETIHKLGIRQGLDMLRTLGIEQSLIDRVIDGLQRELAFINGSSLTSRIMGFDCQWISQYQ